MMKGMIFAERYKLVDFIGQGGMSLVYRAVDIRTGHSVAIKILKTEYNSDKEFLERFQREAQAASLMAHHNIVNLLDVGVEGEHRYLVLEYVSGNTLKEIIRQKGRLNTNTAVQIAIRILSALQHAHDNGIIHRDIKPQNVLVHSDGHVKVADFGIARMTNTFTISKGDTVVGSVHYSSPEQARGSTVEFTSDIYSMGVVLYEMLTGNVPFMGDTPVSVAMQHINAEPPPITDFAPETPPAVVAVVMKALEKNPKKRFQSAREMADALIRARDGKELPAEVSEPVRCAPKAQQAAQNTTAKRPVDPRTRSGNSGRNAPVRKRRRSYASWLATFLMAAAVVIMLTLGIVQIYNQVTNSAIAPDVVGMTAEEGQALAKRQGLNWQQTDMNHDTLPAGIVITQIPEADSAMTKGDSIVVTVSRGPVTISMPDLINMTFEDATAKLKEKNLSMVVFKSASGASAGTVISQNPEKGQPCIPGQEVEITVSGGSTMVPDVSGKTREEAAAALIENSLGEGKIDYVEVEDQKQVGLVMAQSPTAGTLAILDAQVSLTIAKESKEFHSQVTLVFPQGTQGKLLRVVLVEEETEVEQFAAIVTVADGVTPLMVPVSSDLEGTLLCRAYLNNALFLEQEVTLQ